MLIVLSPAKTLDYESPVSVDKSTRPAFVKRSEVLVDILREKSPQQLASLMGISDKLAVLNFDRYADWSTRFTRHNSRQAALAFKGDVYTGLEADQFSESDFEFAQEHLRILSGLYGLLRPLDLMQPYRLEMGTRLPNPEGKDLYAFWGDDISIALNKQLKTSCSNYLVNLASNEYFKSVRPKALDVEVISPVFKDYSNGKYKVISFFAKKARGLMAAWIIKNRLQDPDSLRKFDVDGYGYSDNESSLDKPVFLRKK